MAKASVRRAGKWKSCRSTCFLPNRWPAPERRSLWSFASPLYHRADWRIPLRVQAAARSAARGLNCRRALGIERRCGTESGTAGRGRCRSGRDDALGDRHPFEYLVAGAWAKWCGDDGERCGDEGRLVTERSTDIGETKLRLVDRNKWTEVWCRRLDE